MKFGEATSTHGAGGGVEVGVGGVVGAGGAAAALVAYQLVQDFGEGLNVQRLRQVRIKTSGARALDIVSAAKTCDRHHRNVLPALELPQPLQKLKPVHLGHRNVRKNDVELVVVGEAQCILAIRRRRDIRAAQRE